MNVAISNIAWAPEREDLAARLLQRAGMRGLEVAPTAIWPQPTEVAAAAIDAYRDAWLQRGVRIVAIQALLFGHPELMLFADAPTRQRTADYLVAMARVSARLDATAMVFGSPRNRLRGELGPEAAMDAAERFFRPLAAAVADLGTCLCIEGNAPAYGCDFLTTTAEAAELVRRVDHAGVRLQLDTSTMALNGEDYAATIAAGVPLAGHAHASEPHLVPFGSGGTDHAAAAQALRAAGYEGWVSVEMRADAADVDLAGVAETLRRATAEYGDHD